MDSCEKGRPFLDCRGVWDMYGEMVNAFCTLIVMWLALRNCYRLRRTHQNSINEPTMEESRKRKLFINGFIVVFLLFLLAEITYSAVSFKVDYDFDKKILPKASMGVSIGYKIVEILCVNTLNCLIVSVGKLYWAAVRAYLVGNDVDPEQETGMLILYRRAVEKVFCAVYILSAACVLISAVLLNCGHDNEGGGDYTAENAFNFVVTFISIAIFLFARVQCFLMITKNREIGMSQLRYEKIYTAGVVATCVFRIITFWLAIFDKDPSQYLRNIQPGNCADTGYYHAIYVFFLTILVNLMPPFIFTKIFKKAGTEPVYESLQASLTEDEYMA